MDVLEMVGVFVGQPSVDGWQKPDGLHAPLALAVRVHGREPQTNNGPLSDDTEGLKNSFKKKTQRTRERWLSHRVQVLGKRAKNR